MALMAAALVDGADAGGGGQRRPAPARQPCCAAASTARSAADRRRVEVTSSHVARTASRPSAALVDLFRRRHRVAGDRRDPHDDANAVVGLRELREVVDREPPDASARGGAPRRSAPSRNASRPSSRKSRYARWLAWPKPSRSAQRISTSCGAGHVGRRRYTGTSPMRRTSVYRSASVRCTAPVLSIPSGILVDRHGARRRRPRQHRRHVLRRRPGSAAR